MHLLVILLQQLLGMLPSKQPVPQAEVVRPRSAEPRNSDSASFGGYEDAWGYWTILPMLEAQEIRAPWGAEFHRWRKPAGTASSGAVLKSTGSKDAGLQVPGNAVDHILSFGDSPGEK
jgi:hypothetical protein